MTSQQAGNMVECREISPNSIQNCSKDNEGSQNVLLQIVKNIITAVQKDDVNILKEICVQLESLNKVEDKSQPLWCAGMENPLQKTNMIILACKLNRPNVLKYIFAHEDRVKTFSRIHGGCPPLPEHEDEQHHNAFYYAVSSGNIELLKTLLFKWPGFNFIARPEEFNIFLLKAYIELKLKNVVVSQEVKIFTESILLHNLYLFRSCSLPPGTNVRNISNIEEQIDIIITHINTLVSSYNEKEVDDVCLLSMRLILYTLHFLGGMKSVYTKLPWMEMKFLLNIFIHVKRCYSDSRLVYCALLTKSKILRYLCNFSDFLAKYKNELQSMKERNVSCTISANMTENKHTPMIAELLCDYNCIKNAFLLETMKHYLETVESVGKERENISLLLTRCLQVLKANIVEFPKLSKITCEFLLHSVSASTREVLLCKCNPKLYASSLSTKSKVCNDLLKDICDLNHIVTDILNETKIQVLTTLLEKIVHETCLSNVIELLEVIDTTRLDDKFLLNPDMEIIRQVEKFIKQLNVAVTDKTLYEEDLLSTIHELINSEKPCKSSKKNCDLGFSLLQYLKFYIRGKTITNVDFIHIKNIANQILLHIGSKQMYETVKSIVEMIVEVWNSIVPRMQSKLNSMYNSIMQILFCTEFHTVEIPWINELWNKVNKTYLIYECEKRNDCNEFQCKHSELSSDINSNVDVISRFAPSFFGNSDNFLHNLEMSTHVFDDFLCYQNNKIIHAVVEAVVVDELSASRQKPTIVNPLAFQETSILLEEKLHPFLSNGNVLVDSCLFDPSVATYINAVLLCSDAFLPKKKNPRELKYDSLKLSENHKEDENIITNQNNMFTALTKGELEIVETCIKKGADVNGRNCYSWSSLHFAAKGGSVEAVKFLIDKNLGINVKDVNGQNPLHIAAKYGRKNIVDFLIKETNICIHELDNMGKTPLLIAIQNGYKDIVTLLLNTETRLNTPSSPLLPSTSKICCTNGAQLFSVQESESNVGTVDNLILFLAVASGSTELIDVLLANKINMNVKHHILGSPLHMATEGGFVQIVQHLISKGALVNDQSKAGFVPLHHAVRNGNEQIVRLLLEKGSNINAAEKSFKYTPLMYAVQRGCMKIIKLLLEKGANINDVCLGGRSPLHFAVIKGYTNIVDILIRNGASVNAATKDGNTALHLSATKEDKEILALLIKNGGNINAQNKKNQTALHVASENGCLHSCKLLMTNDADVNTKDVNGSTPLHLSCRGGHIDTIHLLLEKGADANAKDKYVRTPLHIAALYDIFNAIDILAEKGININCRDNKSFTALHLAALKGNIKSIEKLLSKNVNVNATDLNGVSPLHLAVQGNHKHAVEILIKNGASINAKVTVDNSCLNKVNTNWEEKFQTEILGLMLKDVPELQNIFLQRCGEKVMEKRVLTPLYLSVCNNNIDITSLLLSKGAAIWVEGSVCFLASAYFGYEQIFKILWGHSKSNLLLKLESTNLLFVAAFKGRVEMVKMLLSNGSHTPGPLLCSPLYAAAERGHYDIVKLLLAKNANANLIDCFGTTPLHRAAAMGHKKIVELFLQNKVVPAHLRDLVNTTPLEQAAAGGYVEIAEMLLREKKVNINAKGSDDFTALHIAAQEGRLEMTKFLVSKGADVKASNFKGTKPIHVAAREGHLKIVKFFLNSGMDINVRGVSQQTCLHYAASAGQTNVVNFLLQKNIDINVTDTYGMNAMHMAAVMNHKDVVKILLQHGVFYNVVDKVNKMTPLQMSQNDDQSNMFLTIELLFGAVKTDSLPLVEESIQKGVIINAKNKDNVTPLLLASWKGFPDVVDVLLKNSANPNMTGKGGCSPLHYASKFSHLKVAKMLLANGAVYNFKNSAQKTPLDFAVSTDVKHLLTLIDKLFTYVEIGDINLIIELKTIQEVETMKAILKACNEKKETIFKCANNNKYPFMDEIRKIYNNTFIPNNLAHKLFAQKKYVEGLNVLFKK